MENGAPPDIQQLLFRLGGHEKKLTRVEAENTHLKAELARKDTIIAGFIASLEDKIVQHAVAEILQNVCEVDFLGFKALSR